jgi:hypothetical protein
MLDVIAEAVRTFGPWLAPQEVIRDTCECRTGSDTARSTMRYAHLAPGSGSDLIQALEDPSAVAKAWQPKNAKLQSEATSAG